MKRLVITLFMLCALPAFGDEDDEPPPPPPAPAPPALIPPPPRTPRPPARAPLAPPAPRPAPTPRPSPTIRVPPMVVVPPVPPVPPVAVDVDDDDFEGLDDEWIEELQKELSKVPFVDKAEIRRITEDAQRQARDAMRQARDAMRQAREEMRRSRHERDHDDANELAEQAREQAEETLERVREQMEEHVERAREQAEEQREHMRERAEEMRERAREIAEEARERAREHRRGQDCDDDDDDNDVDLEFNFDFDRDVPQPPRPPRRAAPSGPLPPSGQTVLQVAGPVSFHLELTQGGVDVTAGGNEVVVSGPGCQPGNVQFDRSGDEVEAELDVGGCRGPLQVRLPAGSRVRISTIDGNITLRGAFGDVELESVGGTVTVDRAADAQLTSVSGGIILRDATGRVRATTVSGNATIAMSGSAPRFAFESTSGNLVWSGLCGKGCRLDTELFSGQAELKLDPRSSFHLKYETRSGGLKDDLGIRADGERRDRVRGVFGSGDGVVAAETFSGNVRISRR